MVVVCGWGTVMDGRGGGGGLVVVGAMEDG